MLSLSDHVLKLKEERVCHEALRSAAVLLDEGSSGVGRVSPEPLSQHSVGPEAPEDCVCLPSTALQAPAAQRH